jgi:hypothetical protein
MISSWNPVCVDSSASIGFSVNPQWFGTGRTDRYDDAFFAARTKGYEDTAAYLHIEVRRNTIRKSLLQLFCCRIDDNISYHEKLRRKYL